MCEVSANILSSYKYDLCLTTRSVIKLVATYKSKKKGTHKGFMKRLKKTEAVYVLYDYEDKRRKIKPYFVCWTPPNCGDRNTMLYLQERAKILTLVSSKSGEEILNGVKKISGKNDETIERELGHLEEEEELSDWDPDA